MIGEFVTLPGGRFLMGSDDFYPEEGPVHEVEVGPFDLGRYAVTNAEFDRFVRETGYRTVAELPVDLAQLAHDSGDSGDPLLPVVPRDPGSLVFTPTDHPVDLNDWRQWWKWVPGASWCHPYGPESSIVGVDDHPVVQIAFEDASAYASWAGARLASEQEWEYAARGGLDAATFAWGEEPNDGLRANTWQGHFPYENHGARGWVYTAPVGSFAPNGFGLHEMTGNTWEWTTAVWGDRHRMPDSCCPQDSGRAGVSTRGSRVLKGGSHLCSPEYCLRYRPAARSQQTEDSATTHIGFRIARDPL